MSTTENATPEHTATTAEPVREATELQTITPGSDAWPEFAPEWAGCAWIEPDQREPTASPCYVFEGCWSIPSSYREGDPFAVLTIRQRFTPTAHASGEPWIVVGPDGLWADYRPQQVAALLRSIADALAPQSAGERPA